MNERKVEWGRSPQREFRFHGNMRKKSSTPYEVEGDLHSCGGRVDQRVDKVKEFFGPLIVRCILMVKWLRLGVLTFLCSRRGIIYTDNGVEC